MSKSEVLAAIEEFRTSLDIHFQATHKLLHQFTASMENSSATLHSSTTTASHFPLSLYPCSASSSPRAAPPSSPTILPSHNPPPFSTPPISPPPNPPPLSTPTDPPLSFIDIPSLTRSKKMMPPPTSPTTPTPPVQQIAPPPPIPSPPSLQPPNQLPNHKPILHSFPRSICRTAYYGRLKSRRNATEICTHLIFPLSFLLLLVLLALLVMFHNLSLHLDNYFLIPHLILVHNRFQVIAR